MSTKREGSNAKTRSVTFNSILRSKYFALGVKDFHSNKWRDLWGDDAVGQWPYERGRSFAAATKLRHITKTGARVDGDLVNMFIQIYDERGIL